MLEFFVEGNAAVDEKFAELAGARLRRPARALHDQLRRLHVPGRRSGRQHGAGDCGLTAGSLMSRRTT